MSQVLTLIEVLTDSRMCVHLLISQCRQSDRKRGLKSVGRQKEEYQLTKVIKLTFISIRMSECHFNTFSDRKKKKNMHERRRRKQ